MRSLYWKIFLSFWLATILIIISITWITSEVTKKSSIPARERVFMDSYATAAVATFESGQKTALKHWLNHIGTARNMSLYLISSNGEIIGNQTPPIIVNEISHHLVSVGLDTGLLKFGNIIVSHEILSTSGKIYRLIAISEKPLAHFVEIPWAGLTICLIFAIIVSGLLCYWLSVYLTQPLRSLTQAAKSIATGQLSTRVGSFKGHHRDEIDELSGEFDRMAEQLETLINAKERLLQDISHELRSPLARLHIAIELGRKKANHVAKDEFSRMDMECLRLKNLIGEILEFARLDKSFSQLNGQSVDLPLLLKQIIDDANYESGPDQAPGVILKKAEPCQAEVDERLVHRAIENIIRNALHYSAPNPKVEVSLYHDLKRGGILIDIEDNGPGVPEAQLEKIFNPFYRVDDSREKRTGGYGLGLAIAQRAITLHGGVISAMNRQEGGLLVNIGLPIK